jgi:hypothetical protein
MGDRTNNRVASDMACRRKRYAVPHLALTGRMTMPIFDQRAVTLYGHLC